jgi:hypothetical protein
MERTISLSRRKSGFIPEDLQIDVSQLVFKPLGQNPEEEPASGTAKQAGSDSAEERR